MEHLTDIAVFVEVVKANSFTTAARELDLSRSVVSKYITRLEKRLGVRLLNRTTRRLSMTEAGQRFFQQSHSALMQLENAEGEIHAMQAEPKGLLRLSAPSSFGIIHLAPLLPQLRQTYPELNLELSISDKLVDIVDEGIDIAIRIGELPDSSLIAKRISPCRYVVCASPNYLKQHGKPETPDDLTQHNCLLFQFWDAPNQWQFLSRDNQFINIKVQGEIVSNNSLALRKIMLSGGGISMAPTFLVGDDIINGRLVPVLTDYHIKPISIYVVYPHRQYLTAKARAFLEFLSEHIDIDTPYWDNFPHT
ncbi:MAG: LysR family transcriptional regulator [Gammaproteobacteria bacterium]|jgi:DNA-binding transcriptional LysR family regulator